MNVLDENVSRIQRQLLQDWRIPVRHIGCEIGRKGMQDDEIIPIRRLLRHQLFDTQAKRMGTVIRVSYSGLFVWRLYAPKEMFFDWG